VLRDIAGQLSRTDAGFADHVLTHCRSFADIDTIPSIWRRLYTEYFGRNGRTLYLILDGMDEAEEGGDYGREQFLKILPDIIGM
jgi:hypothetical protein